MPNIFSKTLSEILCDDNLENVPFYQDYLPSRESLSKAGLREFTWNCQIDILAGHNDDAFHAELIAQLRKADVFYFLKIRELNDIFSHDAS